MLNSFQSFYGLLLLTILSGVSCQQSASSPASADATQAPASDPLPSWKDGNTRQAILDFVAAVTDESSEDYLPPADRIATFDNDGTLWAEQPLYFQFIFAIDRIRQMAPDHPEWKNEQPFKAILENDMTYLKKAGMKDLATIVMTSHAGMTPQVFEEIASSWLDTARHTRFDQLYKASVYQPMLEVLDYLRANDFKTYIVSGGGIEFLRSFAEEAYGIPSEQVVGSSIKTEFRLENGKADLFRLPEIDFIDDKEGKPIAINSHIGKRPVAAFGNSDGDLAMLQYTASRSGRSLMVIVRHDDAEREYAYDRDSHIGHLDKALDEARTKGWTVVSMKNDWAKVFPGE